MENKNTSKQEKQGFLFDDSILDDIMPPAVVTDDTFIVENDKKDNDDVDTEKEDSDINDKVKDREDNSKEKDKVKNENTDKEEDEVVGENKESVDDEEELLKEYGILSADSKSDIKILNDTLSRLENVETKKQYKDLVDEIKELIKDGKLLPYDTDKSIDEYTVEELKNLIIDNIENVKESAIVDFVSDLPDSIQLAIKYAMDGGQELSDVLRMVADAIDGKNIISGLSDKDVLRTWLKMKDMEDEEIESLINSYERKGIIKEKAKSAREELEKNLYSDLENKVVQQEQQKKNKEEAFKNYVRNVENAIEKMNIDKKIKKELYDGLTNLSYELNNGVKTNKLYYLLNKYQFDEDKMDVVVEALWLLSDAEKYKEYIRNQIKKEVIRDVIKPKLKKAEKSAFGDGEPFSKDVSLSYNTIKNKTIKEPKPKFRWE